MRKIIKDCNYLRQVSSKVDGVEEANEIVIALKETIKGYPNGIGIAAIQIGIPKRVAIVKSDKKDPEFIVLINPEFIEKNEEVNFYGEGCLSFPDLYMMAKRHKEFVIKNQVIDGDSFREETLYFYYSGERNNIEFESVAVEHEMDLMNGKILIDYGKHISNAPIINDGIKISRNDPCPCGSNKKYKKCCIDKS